MPLPHFPEHSHAAEEKTQKRLSEKQPDDSEKQPDDSKGAKAAAKRSSRSSITADDIVKQVNLGNDEAKKKELMEIVADLSSNDKACQLSSIAGKINLVSKQ